MKELTIKAYAEVDLVKALPEVSLEFKVQLQSVNQNPEWVDLIKERFERVFELIIDDRDRKTSVEIVSSNSHRGKIKDLFSVVGKQVCKKSKRPFKSKEIFNTVKTVTVNPYTNKPAFTFEEDDSIVDAWICRELKLEKIL